MTRFYLHFLIELHKGCNKTLSLTDETLVTDLNETCSWTVKSPAKTNIVVQVSVLHLTDPRDSMLLLDKTALIASYTEMDKSGKDKSILSMLISLLEKKYSVTYSVWKVFDEIDQFENSFSIVFAWIL